VSDPRLQTRRHAHVTTDDQPHRELRFCIAGVGDLGDQLDIVAAFDRTAELHFGANRLVLRQPRGELVLDCFEIPGVVDMVEQVEVALTQLPGSQRRVGTGATMTQPPTHPPTLGRGAVDREEVLAQVERTTAGPVDEHPDRHRPGKELVTTGEMADRIKAAVDARTDPDFVIMARTDALAVEGLQAAIDRAMACVEAGADAIFPEAMTELAMYRKFAAAVKVPVLANITEFGSTPLFTLDELRSADVSIALYPLSAFRAMNKAAESVYTAIRRDGHQKNVLDLMQTRDELYDRIGYHAFEAHLDALYNAKK